MTARPDVTALLSEALHQKVDGTTVTDAQRALPRLERSMRRNRQRRVAAVVGAAAAAAAVLGGVAVLATDGDRSAAPLPATSTPPLLPPPGHRIAFSSADQVLVVPDDGGPAVPVLDGTQPRFSPDGRRIVYVDAEGAVATAAVGTWRGGRLEDRAVPAGRTSGAPIWSPDGSQVAYVEQTDDGAGGADLRVVEVATGRGSVLRHFAAPYVMTMDWNPAGGSLVLGFDRSGEGGQMVVDTVDLATGTLTPLLRGWGETLGVRFSPDGSQIAFYSDSRACICVAAADGSDVRPVLTFDGAEPDSARLAWSPDGTRIVWDERFGGRVNVLDLATGRSAELSDAGGRSPLIDWDRP